MCLRLGLDWFCESHKPEYERGSGGVFNEYATCSSWFHDLSATILLQFTQAIRQFGFPKQIRTDNEACFNSKLLRLAFGLLGIKHQTTEVACPWQNGRVERFFLTFKIKINQYTLAAANWSGLIDLDTNLDDNESYQIKVYHDEDKEKIIYSGI